jgi:hypothetical protein
MLVKQVNELKKKMYLRVKARFEFSETTQMPEGEKVLEAQDFQEERDKMVLRQGLCLELRALGSKSENACQYPRKDSEDGNLKCGKGELFGVQETRKFLF